jgi:hypothetical protein
MTSPDVERYWLLFESGSLGNSRLERVELWEGFSHEERLELHVRYYAKYERVIPIPYRSNKCAVDWFKHRASA